MGNTRCLDCINQILWSDASLDRIIINYNSIDINITESTNCIVNLTFIGHIAFSFDGHWDENILDNAEVTNDSPYLLEALRKVNLKAENQSFKGGGIRIINGPWYHFIIRLIDETVIDIVAQDIEINRK